MTPEEICRILSANRHDGEVDWSFHEIRRVYFSRLQAGREGEVGMPLSQASAEIVAGHYTKPRPVETQASVVQWVNETFLDSRDLEYRVLMVTEESIELGLACGVSPEKILQCVTWAIEKVTERDLAHAPEEVGDLLATLYALATTLGCDAHAELNSKMAFNRSRPKSYYDAKTAGKRAALGIGEAV